LWNQLLEIWAVYPKGGISGLRKLYRKRYFIDFDEVMTGFSWLLGGVQELLNVDADIVCFGKVIGVDYQ
jgi:glutamate-1-semialdehyde 2,1-aminomutase